MTLQRRPMMRQAWRLLALCVVTFAALQTVFAIRVAAIAWIDPASTSFQRSEAWRLWRSATNWTWRHAWVDAERIAGALPRAVIASEDAGFTEHSGIEWDAIERAWLRNQAAQSRAERRAPPQRGLSAKPPKIVGGSTITQQLAKNLLLSGERTVLRKAQEAVIALWLELWLDKRRILEVYLNHVEWGEGVFGAQAAAQRYFRVDAARLDDRQAARLAVMLPAPKRFEKRPDSPYLAARTSIILTRMGEVQWP